jgi:hypothetical protein
MKLEIQPKKTLFVAYPWDIYIQSMYEDIFIELFSEWDIRHGSKVVQKDVDLSEIEEFMNRNKHLYDIFVSAIGKSDFFIADITGANPNVMLELGIATQLNKNILIVTSEELKNLPFDISGFRVSKYKNKDELKKIIGEELKIYKKIKSQNFKKYFNGFYYQFPADGELKHGNILILPLPKNIKNLRLRLEYKFLSISNSHDWLGVHLRAQLPGIIKSELVYIRSNHKLESVSFPGQRTPIIGKAMEMKYLFKEDNFNQLELLIEENSLKAITPESSLEDNELLNESLGGVVLHAFAHNAPTVQKLKIQFRNIEIINLDTTNPI